MHELTEDAGHGGDVGGGTVALAAERTPTGIVRYRRTLRAAPPQAFAAIARTVELLRYPVREEDAGAAEIRFSALARTVTAKVDARPGPCTVVVEFASLRWLGSGSSALVILPGVLLGAVVKAQDACFAKRFLENVQRVLEGKGVGRDPARIPGMNALRDKLDIAER